MSSFARVQANCFMSLKNLTNISSAFVMGKICNIHVNSTDILWLDCF